MKKVLLEQTNTAPPTGGSTPKNTAPPTKGSSSSSSSSGNKPPKPTFCPDGYKSCTLTYFKCCKSPRIQVLQECLGMANPDGNWDEYTQRTIEGAYPQYKNTINDDQINKICEYSPDDFCINGYKDCVNEYKKCCVSPKILELKKCLDFQTTTSAAWEALTDAELAEKHPKLKFGFNDEDVRKICHPAKGRGFVDPSNLDF